MSNTLNPSVTMDLVNSSNTTLSESGVRVITESSGNTIAAIRSSLSRFNVGGEAAYTWNSFEPFANATLLLDF